MIRCLPTPARLYESREISENLVTFINVKSAYPIDEDIVVDYSTRNEFKSSTRDWIGIFPRNWLSLQQYLTFEYTLCPSPNAKNPLKRTIKFSRIFHREAALNLEYQFVYISKEIHIMAISTSFRFSLLNRNEPLRCPCALKPCPPLGVFSSTIIQNRDDFTMKTEKSTVSEIPSQITVPKNLPPNCRYCHRQVGGSKVDPLRGNVLAAFSDSLLNRVQRLETELSFAETTLKNAKGARENLAKRLHAYEAFVAEMLGSLAVRGMVKITDDKGKEIILHRMSDTDRSAGEDSKKICALEEEIVALKSLCEKQQQTIVELTEQRKFYISQRERMEFVDRGIQTIPDDPLESDPLDLTLTPEVEDLRFDNDVDKVNLRDGIDLGSKVQTDDDDDGHCIPQNYSKDSKAIINDGPNAVPHIHKISKPSGIFVQGKNVKFAIVRF